MSVSIRRPLRVYIPGPQDFELIRAYTGARLETPENLYIYESVDPITGLETCYLMEEHFLQHAASESSSKAVSVPYVVCGRRAVKKIEFTDKDGKALSDQLVEIHHSMDEHRKRQINAKAARMLSIKAMGLHSGLHHNIALNVGVPLHLLEVDPAKFPIIKDYCAEHNCVPEELALLETMLPDQKEQQTTEAQWRKEFRPEVEQSVKAKYEKLKLDREKAKAEKKKADEEAKKIAKEEKKKEKAQRKTCLCCVKPQIEAEIELESAVQVDAIAENGEDNQAPIESTQKTKKKLALNCIKPQVDLEELPVNQPLLDKKASKQKSCLSSLCCAKKTESDSEELQDIETKSEKPEKEQSTQVVRSEFVIIPIALLVTRGIKYHVHTEDEYFALPQEIDRTQSEVIPSTAAYVIPEQAPRALSKDSDAYKVHFKLKDDLAALRARGNLPIYEKPQKRPSFDEEFEDPFKGEIELDDEW